MSETNAWQFTSLGDVTFEGSERAALNCDNFRVYGVARNEGLTPEAKYKSENISRYKVLKPGMFAYNPMRLNIGSIAYCSKTHTPGLVSPDYVTFGCKEEHADPEFIKYLIRGQRWASWTNAAGVGSVRVRIYYKELARMPLTLPPLTEQRAIANILGVLDDKIELNRRMNETLEGLARAIFQSWFVDFDPVRAQRDGLPPPALSPATAALFPDSFEDSELGKIPKGWNVRPISDVAEVVMGTSPSGDTYNESGVGTPLVNGPVEFGDYFPLKTKWTTEPTRFSESGDLIFCVRGSTTGRRVVSDDRYCLGRGVCAIRAKRGWQHFINKTVDVELPRMLSRATGSVFPSLGGPEMKGFQIVVPDPRIIDEFCQSVGPLQNKIANNVIQSLRLAAIRDALLPKLLSGELRVAEAERLVEDAG